MTFSLKIALALIILSTSVFAQTPTPTQAPIRNLYAAGASYNINAKPSVSGSILYGHYVAAPGTYGFVAIDFLPNTVKPYTVTSNIGAGLAQKMFSVGRASLFMPSTAGVSWSGANAGWQWSGGAAVSIEVRPHFYIIPTARFLKSSVSGGTGYQPIFGLQVGFGK